MLAIVDYGVGNLFSLKSSLSYIGADVMVTSDAQDIEKSDRIILPGVGAFADAARKLRDSGLDQTILKQADQGKPILGICLGMQMMFDKSYEYGTYDGLGLIHGSVVPIENVIPKGYKIPHIGWNALLFPQNKPKSPLFKYVNEGEHVYFVHSYYAADCAESTIAYAEYGVGLTAAAANANVYAAQFHPEKSGEVGLNILRAFCEI